MYIAVDMGHTATSPGASGYIDELKDDRALGSRLIDELIARGHRVIDVTAPDWMSYPDEVNQRVANCNNAGPDLIVSCHFNAGGGTGTEVLYFHEDSWGYNIASMISDNLSRAIGIKNRGAKSNDWVGIICNTNATCVLIETCFVDTEQDAEAYWACPWDNIISAIADGIEEKYWNGASPSPMPEPEQQPEPQPEPQPETTTGTRYRVSADVNGLVWYDEMVGLYDTGGSGDDYAGVNYSPIRWISIDCPGGYQVLTESGQWLPYVYDYNIDDLENGCAGNGERIIALRANGIEYAVAPIGEGFLPWMIGQVDTDGSDDTFAGNGKPIDKLKIK